MTLMFLKDHKCFFNNEHLHFCFFRENIPTLLSNNKCIIYIILNDHEIIRARSKIHFLIMTIMTTLAFTRCCGHLICKKSMPHKATCILKITANYLDHAKKTFENICGHLVIYPEAHQ